ncbi:MAG: DNA polymerase I [Thermodesulfobacteriota bacterium]
MSKPTLYLIDGSSYIFRAYYAVKNLSTSKGFPTNAVYGFTSMLFKFLKDYNPEYLGIIFDSKGKTFRNGIYPEYKANRTEPPPDLKPQFPKIFEMVEAFSIAMFQIEGYEADDLMGTIAVANEKKGIETVLVTGDKDFCQVVSEKVTLLDTMKNKKTGIKEVIERYGITPNQIIDFQALMGDQIDNIPGVRGIGEKTASKLISEFGTLENLYENLSEVKPRYEELLNEYRETAFLSRKLVTIKTDVDMDTDIGRFRFSGFNNQKLFSMFTDLEFKNLFNEIKAVDIENNEDNDEKVSRSEINYDDYELVLTENRLDEIIQLIKNTNELSIDLETTSKLPMEAEIVGFALSPEAKKAFYVPVAHTFDILSSSTQLNRDYVLSKLKPLLENPDIKKIGQNLKYEIVVFRNYGIHLEGIFFDTMTAAHLLDSSFLTYKLDELSRIFLGHTMISYDDVTGKGKKRKGFEEVGLEDAKNYACEDSDVAFLLYKKFYLMLKDNDLLEIYREKLISFIEVIADIEYTGVKIDTNILKKLSLEFTKDIDLITKEIYEKAGKQFNINSTLQLKEILFQDLELPVRKKTKKGGASTDSDVLTELGKLHEVPELVLKYRLLSKLKSTYVDSLPKLINLKTGRIHTSFHPVGTTTGRLSSSDPNLQNIPIKTHDGKRIRQAFVPKEGCVLLSADYSQIELRLLAHFSEDETLIDAFKRDQDIHARTAAEIFGINENNVTPEMRRLAKNINFGIIYGISAFGLSKQLGTPVSVSKDYIDKYLARYSSVKNYMDSSILNAQNRGYAKTLIGRRRPIKELNSKNRVQRGMGERAAINTPIQGSAADIINSAMVTISKRLNRGFKSRMILQVHDELLFEIYEDELPELKSLISQDMENAWKLKVPLKVEIGTGKNWAEAH